MFAALVRHRATVLLVVAIIFIFGTFTYRQLPREAAPDIDVPVVMVTTPYPGVSPADIEKLVTVPIENELAGVKDLKKLSSTSAEGVSLITLEFETEVVIEDALQRVRDRVDRARTELPDDAEDTDIRELSFSDFPIVIITLAGDVDEELLKKHGEDLEDELKRLPGVLDAKLSGGRTREIRVEIDPHRLNHYSLSLSDVTGAIANENVNVPGGDVSAGSANYLLRVPADFEGAEDVESVAIKRVGKRPVFVSDVGKVVDGFAERSTYSRMNGEPAVSIAVTKRAGANILDIVDRVKEVTAAHQKQWPEGVRYRVLGDQSSDVRDMVSELENNIITALILVVGVILFFMGARNSLFVAVAIPLSMLLGMILIWAFDMTLNMVVLFSLILALGMLVDNAIVLVENIYRHVEMGESLEEASVNGTREIAGAVTASTLTTVAAFVPLLFWTGIMGEFMGFLPKTVVIVLSSSLVVAVGILPTATSRFMRKAKPKKGDSPDGAPSPGPVMRIYRSQLAFAIRHRYLTMGAMTVLLVGTFIAYAQLNHGTEFFPETEPNRANVIVRAPDGTTLEATDAMVRRIEGMLASEANVDVYVAEVGVAGDGFAGSTSSANEARITVDFLPHHTKAKPGETARVEDTRETIKRIRERVSVIPGAEITVDKQEEGPPVGKPIAVEVSGEDFHQIGSYAAKLRRKLAGVEGATDLKDNYRVGRPEMRLRINRGAAKRVGASTQEVAGTLRTAVNGTVASKLRDGDDEYDITVQLAARYRDDVQAITGLRIPGRVDTSPKTFAVPISAVATYELAGGAGAIRHIDQKRVVTIEGEVLDGFNENAVRADVVKLLDTVERPKGVDLRLGGANDEQRKSEEFLSTAFLVAIFLIGLVLVSQFNRYDVPLIILGSVVLSLIGVLWGLVITGTSFGIIMTGLGVISLAGVVVNNAIVLLDYVQQLRASGSDVDEALMEAGMTRFRPVILTAITTILGLVPMAAGVNIDFASLKVIVGSQSSEWWGPMAVAVIFGLAFATVLTLVMVPTMYRIVEDMRRLRRSVTDRVASLFRRPRGAGADAE